MTADFSVSTIDLARTPDFALGTAMVRPALRRVESPGRSETLEPRVMQALVVLAERAGEVTPKDELIDRCWGGRIVGDDAITQCIAKVRRVGMAHGAFALEAVPRVGYRLAVIADAVSGTAMRSVRKRWLAALAASVVLVGAVALMAWLFRPLPLAGLTHQTAVAVEPFRASSEDADARGFAVVAADEVTARLADVQLPVAGPQARGRRLIVDGTVSRSGGTLRVRPRLLDSRSRTVLWTGDFEAPANEADKLTYQLGWRVAAAVQMTHDVLRFPSRDLTPEALALFVQGRDNVRQSSWKGSEARERLTEIAPLYARGHAEQAMALTAAAAYADGDRAEALLRRARAEARRSLELEARDPFTLAATTMTLRGDDWAGRTRLVRQAEALQPAGAPSPWSALLLLDTGRQREALLMIQQMISTGKGHPIAGASYIETLYLTGQQQDALARVDEFLSIRPEDAGLLRQKMLASLISGDAAAALADLKRPGVIRPYLRGAKGMEALRRFAIARISGRAADREAASSALREAAGSRHLSRADATRLLLALGELEAALDMAEAYAADPRTTRTANFFEPRFLFAADTAPLRRSPRFVGVVERLGLAEHWRRTGQWPDFCETEPKSVCGLLRRRA